MLSTCCFPPPMLYFGLQRFQERKLSSTRLRGAQGTEEAPRGLGIGMNAAAPSEFRSRNRVFCGTAFDYPITRMKGLLWTAVIIGLVLLC